MCNNCSRRWLVKQQAIAESSNTSSITKYECTLRDRHPSTPRQCHRDAAARTKSTASILEELQMLHTHKMSASPSSSLTPPVSSLSSSSSTLRRSLTLTLSSISTRTRANAKAILTRSVPTSLRVNQIIEVLLTILLANCLTSTLAERAVIAASEHVAAYSTYSGPKHSFSLSHSNNNNNNQNYNYNYNHNRVRGPNHSSSPSSSSSTSASRNSNVDDVDINVNFRQPHRSNIDGSNNNNDIGLYNNYAYQHLPMEQSFVETDVGYGSSLPQRLQQRSQNFKISPKPCAIGHIEGTCMFVWECIKSEGRHVGMCVDSFMFGSCCAHNYTDNIVVPQTFSYTRPTKPVGISSLNHRPRPPNLQYRPGISGMTTIERPHGAGTLVIRPSGPHHQGSLHKPQHTKPSYDSSTATTSRTTTTTATTTTTSSTNSMTGEPQHLLWTSNDLQSVASMPSSFASSGHTDAQTHPSPPFGQLHHQQQQQQHHWHLTTEPNFITRPRPPNWEKPLSLPVRPKPSKPTKPPPRLPSQSQSIHSSTSSVAVVYSTRKPMPLPMSTSLKPTKPPQVTRQPKPTRTTTTTTTTTTRRPPTTEQFYFKPTPATSTHWGSSTNSNGLNSHIISRPTKPISLSTVTSTQNEKPTIGTAVTKNPAPVTNHPLINDTIASIETNEIRDAITDGIPTIKTVSAARSECGLPVLARPETRIVGGKSAAFGRWPWQVSVRRTSFFGFSSTHRCGGALINENWIATAGHCVDDLLISQIRIRVGEYDFSHVQEQLPYIERGVVKKVVHPKYNFFTYEYDLALVKLEQSLEFAPHVSPICLPQTDSLLIGMNATVTGWGRLSEGGTLPSVLQEVSVPIVSNDNCKTMFLRAGRQEFIPDIFLCAGYETGGQDSCQGDSGGPLQVKSQDGHFFLAGIISWGIGCAEANLPGVCTRISKFVPWIMENVT